MPESDTNALIARIQILLPLERAATFLHLVENLLDLEQLVVSRVIVALRLILYPDVGLDLLLVWLAVING